MRGKVLHEWGHYLLGEDHPRLCGEKLWTATKSRSARGSPPPMRGKVFVGCQVFFLSGITPAYAGKSVLDDFSHEHLQDHPRLCGEKFIKLPHNTFIVGITPAYAGKSPACDFCGRGTWDHPRLCGEKLTVAIYSHLFSGSPPPMRGKVPKSLACQITNGITPAYAGKSPDDLCAKKLIEGSPPPMRGKA